MAGRTTETSGKDFRLKRLEEDHYRLRSALYGGVAMVAIAAMVAGRKLIELGPPYAWTVPIVVFALLIYFAFLARHRRRADGVRGRDRAAG